MLLNNYSTQILPQIILLINISRADIELERLSHIILSLPTSQSKYYDNYCSPK